MKRTNQSVLFHGKAGRLTCKRKNSRDGREYYLYDNPRFSDHGDHPMPSRRRPLPLIEILEAFALLCQLLEQRRGGPQFAVLAMEFANAIVDLL